MAKKVTTQPVAKPKEVKITPAKGLQAKPPTQAPVKVQPAKVSPVIAGAKARGTQGVMPATNQALKANQQALTKPVVTGTPAKPANPAKNTAKPATFNRVGPGLYRNEKTGALVKSATNPGDKAKANAAKQGNKKVTQGQPAQQIGENTFVGDTGNQFYQQPYESRQGAELRDLQYEQSIDLQQGQAPIAQEAVTELQQGPDAYSDIQQVGEYNPNAMREEYTQKAYQNYMKNVEPQLQKEQEDFEQMAANRGWTPGSEIYESEKNRLMQQQNLQKENLLQQAYTTAGQEGRGDYGAQLAGIAPRMALSQGQRYGDVADVAALQGIQPGTDQYYQAKYGAQQAQLDRKLQREAIAKAGSGGGGGGGQPYVTPSILPQVPSTQGSNPDFWGQLGQQMLPGVGVGVMNYLLS